MRTDTRRAAARLEQRALTCVLCRGEMILESTARGVAPLLGWLDSGTSFADFSAADKVVGAGAAYLYVLLGVAEVYAAVISEPAWEILTRFGVSVLFEQKVPHIVNRTGDGHCPIETAVADAADPADALRRIRSRLAELRA